jgi:sugar phosphate isomerase/epimerase
MQMSWQIGTRIPPRLRKSGFAETASWAATMGLELLDVPHLDAEVKAACDGAGLKVGTVDSVEMGRLLSKDDATREQAAEAVMRQLEQIALLEGRLLFLVLVPEDANQPRRESFAIWKDSFPVIVRKAEAVGVSIAIEGWPGPAPQYPTIGCTPEMLRAMFEAEPSRHFGLNYDPSHFVRLGIDHLRALAEFGDRVLHVHGKDTELLREGLYEYGTQEAAFGAKLDFSEGPWRYTIPGHGEVEWQRVAAQLASIGYTGAISIELEDHLYWGSIEKEKQGIVKAVEHLALYFR